MMLKLLVDVESNCCVSSLEDLRMATRNSDPKSDTVRSMRETLLLLSNGHFYCSQVESRTWSLSKSACVQCIFRSGLLVRRKCNHHLIFSDHSRYGFPVAWLDNRTVCFWGDKKDEDLYCTSVLSVVRLEEEVPGKEVARNSVNASVLKEFYGVQQTSEFCVDRERGHLLVLKQKGGIDVYDIKTR